MRFDYYVFDEWEMISKSEVESNKRRAKERVRKAKQIALGEKLIAIKYKLLEWLS